MTTEPAATPAIETPDKPDGPLAAAIIAGGIGALTLGIFTTLVEASSAVKDALNWSDPVGPLAGKTGLAVIAFLLSWVVLHVAFRRRTNLLKTATTVGLILIALGFLGTFPTFFQMFAAE